MFKHTLLSAAAVLALSPVAAMAGDYYRAAEHHEPAVVRHLPVAPEHHRRVVTHSDVVVVDRHAPAIDTHRAAPVRVESHYAPARSHSSGYGQQSGHR